MDCVFCRIAQKTLPTELLFEDEHVCAFNDVHPQAPVHVLIIPKQHIATLNETNETDSILLAKLLLTAQQLAAKYDLADNGYRLIFNTNPNGGQTVYHLHLHLLGGRRMTWPPG